MSRRSAGRALRRSDAGAHGLVAFGLAGEVPRLAAARARAPDGRHPRRPEASCRCSSAPGPRACPRPASSPYCGGGRRELRRAPGPGLGPARRGRARRLLRPRSRPAYRLPVMIQDAPAYRRTGRRPAIVGAGLRTRAPNVRLVKLEAGPSELSRWIEELGGELSVWGGDAGHVPARRRPSRRGRSHSGCRPRRPAGRGLRDRGGGRSSRRGRAVPPRAADDRVRDPALDRPLQRLCEARPRTARRARECAGLRAPAASLGTLLASAARRAPGRARAL